MPPRAAKKATGGPGTKKAAAKKTAAAAAKPPAEPVKAAEEVSASTTTVIEEVTTVVEEVREEAREEIKMEEVVEEVKPEEDEPAVVPDSKAADSAADAGDEEETKEANVEDDVGGRLELEDNEPEYDPEEDTMVDYDDKEMDDDVQEQVDGGDDDGEGDVGEEEEGDVGEEDVEGEEDNENADEEHENDAEEEDHHEVVKERRKRKEFEVFVGGLDKDATEADLKKVFTEVGEITEVRLMMNPLTKKNKGFAFLRFATVEQAKRAVSDLKNPVVNGKQCGVAPSQDSDTLFVGNICKTWTKDHLKESLKTYGIENMEDLTLVEDTNNEGMNRGFAFLEFSSRSEAMDAFRRLQKRDVMFGVDRCAKVAFADSFIEPDDEIMAQVKTVFIDGLPASWDEDHVKECAKKYGEIEKIELARNMPAAKRKDFGFVTFSSHDSAVACAEGISNAELGEGDNKVKVRARLSRPLQRGRGKHAARADFRTGRGAPRGGRLSWTRSALPPPRFPGRGFRGMRGRGAPIRGRISKRPIGFRERRPAISMLDRPRRLPPPERFYDRRPPVPAYPKSSSKRDYRREDFPAPRSRAAVDYGSRVPAERRHSYRDDISSRGTGYSNVIPRSTSRNAERRTYPDDGYGRKLERPLPTYREGRSREYDPVPGSKRPYSAMDDDAPRYADVGSRHSRARLDYDVNGGSSQYDDAYAERIGRSHTGYGGGRSSLSGQESHGLYSSRQGMNYGGGSVSGGDVGMYSSNLSSSYLSRGSDVGGSSYSSLYSGRNLGGSGYLGGGGSGSYY